MIRNLICPACGNTLVEITVEDLKVDICRGGCAGVWFDRNELEVVDEKHERQGLVLMDIAFDPTIVIDPQKPRNCPVCKDVNMRKHFWSVKGEIELDECDKCGGIWLDRGELEKIRTSYENEAEKIADADRYFRDLSNKLLIDAENERRKMTPWYDKLTYAIFGV